MACLQKVCENWASFTFVISFLISWSWTISNKLYLQTMLREKQITALSSSARTFLIGGSRCNAADGSSCSCTEDETCVSRWQHIKKHVLPAQKPSSLVSKATSEVDETLVSANSVSGPACCKAEGVDKSSTIQQIGSASSPASKPDSVTYACDIDGVQEHVDHLSPLNADHLMVLQL